MLISDSLITDINEYKQQLVTQPDTVGYEFALQILGDLGDEFADRFKQEVIKDAVTDRNLANDDDYTNFFNAFDNTDYLLNKLKQVLNEPKFSQRINSWLQTATTEDFIDILIQSKRTHCKAESELNGNNLDCNLTELALLSDINITVPVSI